MEDLGAVELRPHRQESFLQKKPWRALTAFWIFGLCNNFGYVVMLVAANDIITQRAEKLEGKSERNCADVSTGAILLADIIPSLIVKLLGPFFPLVIKCRIITSNILVITGLLAVALSDNMFWAVVGVVCASVSAGLGEISYLAYTSFYHKNVVSTWSSGTGGAGLLGAVFYTVVFRGGFKAAILSCLTIPIIALLTFFILLPKPFADESKLDVQLHVNSEELHRPRQALIRKLRLIPPMFKFMICLGLVYFFEYFINQGAFQLMNFQNFHADPDEQYRILQIMYQLGVFISRSSVNVVQFKKIWVMALLQGLNVIIYYTEVIFYYMPTFWIVIFLTLWSGLLGGLAYVNTYYRVSTEVAEENKQFSMSVLGYSDSLGITLAGVVSMPVYNAICRLPVPKQNTS